MKKSLQVTRWGGPEVLQMVSEPSPQVHPDAIRIQVTAAGVNFADLMMRMGLYADAPRLPFVPGYEIAGVIIEVGSQVESFQVGDRVFGGTRFGGYTTEIVLPAAQVRKIPKRLTDVQAAAIPVNFLTAWIALHEMARVRAGDRVLVPSAAGGVGLAAVQIAVQAGAQVVGLVSSLTKAPLLESLGVTEVFTYAQWNNIPIQKSFDIILENQGGKSLKASLNHLLPTGRLVAFGVSQLVSGQRRSFSKLVSFLLQTPFLTPYKLMMQNQGIFGLNVLPLFEPPVPGSKLLLYRIFDRVIEHFESGAFRVEVAKTFPLENAGEAHDFLSTRKSVGKIILTCQ